MAKYLISLTVDCPPENIFSQPPENLQGESLERWLVFQIGQNPIEKELLLMCKRLGIENVANIMIVKPAAHLTPHAPDAAVPPCQPCEHGVYGACQKCGTNVPPRR